MKRFKQKNITIVAGARPNFMKIAPLVWQLRKQDFFNYKIVHTGQHYDYNMSGVFFKQLDIDKPHINLNSKSGSQANQVASIMVNFEKFLIDESPDLVIVVGDVNSTMACSITAKKMGIKVAHIEAGIRSGDITMPEEINRIVTDSISDIFFTTTTMASDNLKRNGISNNSIFFVGNIMIDSLLKNISKFKKPLFYDEYNLCKKSYMVITLHRPSNVDSFKNLKLYLDEITNNSSNVQLIFPIHPRTQNILDKNNYQNNKIIFVDPLPYLEFMYLIKNSKAIITDSGGITEEATVLNIPCITLRDSTERPETVTIGTNILIGNDINKLKKYIIEVIEGNWKNGNIPKLWDGNTSKRIIDILFKLFENEK